MDVCITSLFAYKTHSTNQFVSTIKKITIYNHLNHSPAYVYMLDTSKAFDKIHLLLFKKLWLKGKCPLLLRFTIQNICGKLNYCISHEYAISNVVKQGGIMSQVLFNMYVQDLIECLSRMSLGNHMGNHFSGCLICADDKTLLAPSADGLNCKLKLIYKSVS